MHIEITWGEKAAAGLWWPFALAEAHAPLLGLAGAFAAVIALVLNVRNVGLSNALALIKQMQDLNIMVIRNDGDLAQIYAECDLDFPRDECWVRELYLVFYHFNLIHDIRVAKKRRLLPTRHTLLSLDEIIRLTLRRAPEQVHLVFKEPRGYHPSFKRYIWERARDLQRRNLLSADFWMDLPEPPPWWKRWLATARELIHLMRNQTGPAKLG